MRFGKNCYHMISICYNVPVHDVLVGEHCLKYVRIFIRLEPNVFCNIYDTEVLKLLARLQLGFSRLSDCKFRRYFQDCVCLICTLVVRILKRQLTSFFTAHIIIMQGKFSFKRYIKLVETIQKRVIQQ